MRVIIAGMGTQGKKRRAVAGADVVATVDPVGPADYARVSDVPLSLYDAVLVCTPDAAKIGILEHLLRHQKHVLVEKPLLSEKEGDLERLQALSAEHRAVCYTAYNHRFEPHILRVKQVLESGQLGKVHAVRLFYGNGTARDVRNSPWRDQGMGILPDLGSHLLDTVRFWLGTTSTDFETFSLRCLENKAPDYALFGSKGSPLIVCEISLLSWKNAFQAEVIGELGSAHIQGLCKWGPSVFTRRTRVLPSGKPAEEAETLESPDPTWAAEYAHFKSLCLNPTNQIDRDLWMNKVFGILWRNGTGISR